MGEMERPSRSVIGRCVIYGRLVNQADSVLPGCSRLIADCHSSTDGSAHERYESWRALHRSDDLCIRGYASSAYGVLGGAFGWPVCDCGGLYDDPSGGTCFSDRPRRKATRIHTTPKTFAEARLDTAKPATIGNGGVGGYGPI